MMTVALASPASAQPTDEPGPGPVRLPPLEVLEIEAPAPPAATPAPPAGALPPPLPVRADRMNPPPLPGERGLDRACDSCVRCLCPCCSTCSSLHTCARSSTRPRSSAHRPRRVPGKRTACPNPPPPRFLIHLDVNGGYLMHVSLGSLLHGPVVDGALGLTWGMGVTRSPRLGLRLHGYYVPEIQGEPEGQSYLRIPYPEGASFTRHTFAWGAHLGFLLEVEYAWLSPGVGLAAMTHTLEDPLEHTVISETEKSLEVILAGGVQYPLGRHLGLRLTAEGGLAPGLGIRGQLTMGLSAAF